jgi:DNA-binding FadR family transcriptional regulator
MSWGEPIARRKLSDEIFDRLKTIILSGELGVGDPLPSERELMEHFGVGRPAIREAMQALGNLGLINISHGERARVSELTPDALFRQIDLPAQLMLSASAQSLQHLLDARMFFERGMIRAAAQTATAADIDRLHEAIKEQRDASADIQAFIRHDVKFHVTIASMAGNPIFHAISHAMLSWLRQYHTEMLHWSGNENITIAEHAAIAERVAAHDPDGAEEAMIRHLKRSNTLYVHSSERSTPVPPVAPAGRSKRTPSAQSRRKPITA